MFKIKVSDIRKCRKGCIVAFCNVELTSQDGTERIIIVDARVMRNQGGQHWVSYYRRACPKPNGSVVYAPIFFFSKELAKRMSAAVLSEFKVPESSQAATDSDDPLMNEPESSSTQIDLSDQRPEALAIDTALSNPD